MPRKTIAKKEAGIIEAPVLDKKVMVVHHCTQEGRIGELMALMDRIVKQIFGNGREGLIETVPALSGKIDNLALQIKDLATNVSGLMKFMNEGIGAEKATDKLKLSARQWTGIIISGITGVSAIAVTIIIELLK